MEDVVTLSVGGVDDANDLVAFYSSNPHAFYAFRDSATLEGLNEGRFILARRNRSIVAAAGIFPVSVAGEQDYFELGQARSALAGGGLYRWMVWLRLLRAQSIGIAPDRLYAEVDEPNTGVQESLSRLGFEIFAPGALYDAAVAALPPEKRPDSLGYDFVFMRPTRGACAQAETGLVALVRGDAMSGGADMSVRLFCAPEALDLISNSVERGGE